MGLRFVMWGRRWWKWGRADCVCGIIPLWAGEGLFALPWGFWAFMGEKYMGERGGVAVGDYE